MLHHMRVDCFLERRRSVKLLAKFALRLVLFELEIVPIAAPDRWHFVRCVLRGRAEELQFASKTLPWANGVSCLANAGIPPNTSLTP
jgi:hypothetical protein